MKQRRLARRAKSGGSADGRPGESETPSAPRGRLSPIAKPATPFARILNALGRDLETVAAELGTDARTAKRMLTMRATVEGAPAVGDPVWNKLMAMISDRLALLHAQGLIRPGELFVHESITGSRFTSSIDALTTVGPYDAVVPAVAGQAWITGFSQMGLHPTDPYPQGFTVADTWMQEFSLLAG